MDQTPFDEKILIFSKILCSTEEVMRVKNSQKIFSENVIQIILTSQELARAENSQSVELHHLLGGLIHHKKSSAGVILEKLKIQKKDINFPQIQNNLFFYEVALSKSSQKILQKALEESTKVERWNTDFRSIFILKAIILDKSESLNCFLDDFDKKKLEIYNLTFQLFNIYKPNLIFTFHKSCTFSRIKYHTT